MSTELNCLLAADIIERVDQGFSKSAFKGPNQNFHQCQRSRPEQLVITKQNSSLHDMHNK